MAVERTKNRPGLGEKGFDIKLRLMRMRSNPELGTPAMDDFERNERFTIRRTSKPN